MNLVIATYTVKRPPISLNGKEYQTVFDSVIPEGIKS